MSWRRFVAIFHKEGRHIVRDPLSLAMALAIPLLLLILFGYALTLDVDGFRRRFTTWTTRSRAASWWIVSADRDIFRSSNRGPITRRSMTGSTAAACCWGW